MHLNCFPEQSTRSSVGQARRARSTFGVDESCASVCNLVHDALCQCVSCMHLFLQPSPAQQASVLPGSSRAMPDQALPCPSACLLSAGGILDRLAAYLVVVPLALLGRIPMSQFLAQTVLDLGSALYTWKLYSEDHARQN